MADDFTSSIIQALLAKRQQDVAMSPSINIGQAISQTPDVTLDNPWATFGLALGKNLLGAGLQSWGQQSNNLETQGLTSQLAGILGAGGSAASQAAALSANPELSFLSSYPLMQEAQKQREMQDMYNELLMKGAVQTDFDKQMALYNAGITKDMSRYNAGLDLWKNDEAQRRQVFRDIAPLIQEAAAQQANAQSLAQNPAFVGPMQPDAMAPIATAPNSPIDLQKLQSGGYSLNQLQKIAQARNELSGQMVNPYSNPMTEIVDKYRTEFGGTKEYQMYSGAKTAVEKMYNALGDDSGSSDIPFVYGLIQTQEPTGIVRGGEAEFIKEGLPFTEEIKNKLLAAFQGKSKLGTDLKMKVFKTALGNYKAFRDNYVTMKKNYENLLKKKGVSDTSGVSVLPKSKKASEYMEWKQSDDGKWWFNDRTKQRIAVGSTL